MVNKGVEKSEWETKMYIRGIYICIYWDYYVC